MSSILNVKIEDNLIKAKVDICNLEDYMFAYYVLLNDKPINKTGYGYKNEYEFALNESGIYTITAFIRHKGDNESKIINSEKMRYVYNWKRGGGMNI